MKFNLNELKEKARAEILELVRDKYEYLKLASGEELDFTFEFKVKPKTLKEVDMYRIKSVIEEYLGIDDLAAINRKQVYVMAREFFTKIILDKTQIKYVVLSEIIGKRADHSAICHNLKKFNHRHFDPLVSVYHTKAIIMPKA